MSLLLKGLGMASKVLDVLTGCDFYPYAAWPINNTLGYFYQPNQFNTLVAEPNVPAYVWQGKEMAGQRNNDHRFIDEDGVYIIGVNVSDGVDQFQNSALASLSATIGVNYHPEDDQSVIFRENGQIAYCIGGVFMNDSNNTWSLSSIKVEGMLGTPASRLASTVNDTYEKREPVTSKYAAQIQLYDASLYDWINMQPIPTSQAQFYFNQLSPNEFVTGRFGVADTPDSDAFANGIVADYLTSEHLGWLTGIGDSSNINNVTKPERLDRFWQVFRGTHKSTDTDRNIHWALLDRKFPMMSSDPYHDRRGTNTWDNNKIIIMSWISTLNLDLGASQFTLPHHGGDFVGHCTIDMLGMVPELGRLRMLSRYPKAPQSFDEQ